MASVLMQKGMLVIVLMLTLFFKVIWRRSFAQPSKTCARHAAITFLKRRTDVTMWI